MTDSRCILPVGNDEKSYESTTYIPCYLKKQKRKKKKKTQVGGMSNYVFAEKKKEKEKKKKKKKRRRRRRRRFRRRFRKISLTEAPCSFNTHTTASREKGISLANWLF